MTKYDQFAAVASTNDDLEDLIHMRNIGYYDSKLWWVGDGSGNNPYIQSAPSITGATTDEHLIAGIIPSAQYKCCRVWDNDIYGMGTDGTTLYWSYSTDGGVGWTDVNSGALNSLYVIDFVRFSDGTTYVFYGDTTPGGDFVYFNNLAGANIDSVEIDDFDQVYAGYTDFATDIYYFLYRDTSSDLQMGKLTKSTGVITIEEAVTGITEPAAYEVDTQQYWKKNNIEIIMDQDHLYSRTNGAAWVAYSDTGSTTNGIIWDSDGVYIINYIIWKDSIYTLIDGSGFSRVQGTTADAYVGWEDWFANGADTIYQTTKTTIAWATHTVSQAFYTAPKIGLSGFKATFQNQYLRTYAYLDAQIAEFFIQLAKTGDFPYVYKALSGAAMDLTVPMFNRLLTAKNGNEMVKDFLDTYCSHLWHGRGTNGDVNTFTASQIDGTDLGGNWFNTDDNGNTLSTYLAQKTFYNSYSGKNEIFEHVLSQDDQSVGFNCSVHTLTGITFTVLSGWIADSVATGLVQISGRQGTTNIGSLRIDGGQLQFIGDATNNLQAATANYMYHYVMVFGAATTAVYINGALIGTYNNNNAVTTGVSRIYYETGNTDTGMIGYHQNYYIGDSPSNAMNTLDSISPLMTTDRTITFDNKQVRDGLYLIGSFEGMVPSIRPNNQLYFDAYSSSGITLTDANWTFIGDPVPEELNPSIVTVHYNAGEISAYGTGNGAPSHYYFAELDLTMATLMAAQLLADKNQVITKYRMGIRGRQLDIGTTVIATCAKNSLTAKLMYITAVEPFDARSLIQYFTMSDVKWSPYIANRITDLAQQVENVR